MVFLLVGCASCFELPDEGDPGTDPPVQDPDTGDSGDTADTGDTAEPLPGPCELEEVEDGNYANDFSQVTTLPLDTWACGAVDVAGDVEYYRFTTFEPGWLMVSTEAELRGSPADMTQILSLEVADESVVQAGRAPRSADPLNLFLAPVAGEYFLALGEAASGGGEEYRWWVRASETKAPVEWDLQETEPNGTVPQAEVLVEGARYFGVLGEPGDDDWFHLDVPEGANFLTCEMDAYDFGSAANMEMTLHWGGSGELYIKEDGIDQRTGSEDPWQVYDLAYERGLSEDTIESDRRVDPAAWPEGSVDWSSFSMRVHDYDESAGSMFHWYTLWCTFSTEEK